MPRAMVVIAPLLLIALFAVVLSTTGPAHNPLHTTLEGRWQADGTVTAASDPERYQPPGTRITRSWVFSERCTNEQCQLWLTREVADGRTEAAPVRRLNGKLHAVFRKSTPSCSADPGSVTRFFDITVAAGDHRLTATEGTDARAPGCALERSTSSVRWTARRVGD